MEIEKINTNKSNEIIDNINLVNDINLLINEKKIKKYNDYFSFSSKNSNTISNFNINYLATLKKMTSHMKKYSIKKFNLEKYIVANNKFKMLINGINNSKAYPIVYKIINYLYILNSLSQNIIIFTESKKLIKIIKKICVGNNICVYIFNTKEFNYIKFINL